MKKRILGIICLTLVSVILLAQPVFAQNTFSPINILYSENGDIITDTVLDAFSILAGNNVNIQQNVLGTTIVIGNYVDIEGDIDGDVIALGSNITIDGSIGGNFYAAGQSISLKGEITKDAFVFGSNIILDKQSIIARDAHLFAASVSSFGDIGRDAAIFTANYSLNGDVGRNLSVSADNITISDDSVIAGDFNYQSNKEANILDGASITGEVNKYEIQQKTEEIKSEKEQKAAPVKAFNLLKYLLGILFTLGVSLLLWAVMLLIAPKVTDKFANLLAKRPGSAAGFGAIALFLTPIALIILLFTVVGIPLSLITGAIYGILLYLSFYITAASFGIVMFKKVFGLKDLHKNIWYILAGVLVVKLLTMLPFIGWIISLASVIFGFGLFILLCIEARKKQA